MAIKGQKFNLDLDAPDFQFDIQDDDVSPPLETFNVVREIKERESTAPPPPPKLKSRSGFPEHRPRLAGSKFKQQRQQQAPQDVSEPLLEHPTLEPSDRAIAHHLGRKYGLDPEAKERAQISAENRQKLAAMSTEEIEQARSELMSGLNPALIQRLLSRANIEDGHAHQGWNDDEVPTGQDIIRDDAEGAEPKKVRFETGPTISQESDHLQIQTPGHSAGLAGGDPSQFDQMRNAKFQVSKESPLDKDASTAATQSEPTVHFPVPPRDAAAFPDLDPNSASFLEDLRSHYFADTPHDPNSLTWLQDPTEEEKKASPYAASQTAYAPSDIRFGFNGRLIPPSESESIPVDKGLHHHGDAPDSAGYTIPELAMLCRSSLPNQRCVAYQTLGRILYRLGRGDYGPKGTTLNEGLWSCIEHERPLEVIMAEANRKGGHISAKTYATEALWLWRKGGGGDRGLLKDGQRVVR